METHVNEYVVIVQMASTGLTTDLFAALHAARNVAEKCSEVWPRVIEADVHQWFDGMATGPKSASGTTLAASRATWPTSGKSGCSQPCTFRMQRPLRISAVGSLWVAMDPCERQPAQWLREYENRSYRRVAQEPS